MRILRIRDVADRIGGSVALVWRLAAEDGDFPKPVKVTPGITGFLESEVDAFIAVRVERSRAMPTGKRDTSKAAAASVASRRMAAGGVDESA